MRLLCSVFFVHGCASGPAPLPPNGTVRPQASTALQDESLDAGADHDAISWVSRREEAEAGTAHDALAFLRRVEQNTGGPFELEVGPNPALEQLSQPPFWTLPPSQRPASRGAVEAEGMGGVRCMRGAPLSGDASDEWVRVQALELDARHHLLLVSGLGDLWPNSAVCLVSPDGVATCAETEHERLVGVISAPAPGQWLIVTETTYGNMRSTGQGLTLVSATADGLVTNTRHLGAIDGIGEGCDDHDSYCVWFRGHSAEFTLHALACVTVRPGPSWTATHVRVGDLWLDEVITPATAEETAYRVVGTELVQGACLP